MERFLQWLEARECAGPLIFAQRRLLLWEPEWLEFLQKSPTGSSLQVNLPEAMIDCGEDEAVFEKAFHWCDVLIHGPGLGCSEKSRRKVQWFLEKAFLLKKRVVLDADGLNLLTENPKWKKYLSDHVVVTPI